MNLEARVEELEDEARKSLLTSVASDIVIRALIATHPNPEYFRVVFASLIERQVALLADHGFETGRKLRVPQGLASDLRKQCQAWLDALPPTPSADESDPPAS